MSLVIGQQLGSYEITALLGKGGMGEVYRARDAKLKREVAIKVMPEEFSRDDDRLGRFQREAEVLAALNHPNIAAIYDLQEVDNMRFLVLELVEGETLAERIARGPLQIGDALHIAHSICEALEAAHERGIIHRDLKPANVKITPDGKVKVLDFGLARAMENGPTAATLSNSPTMISAAAGGMILGTAAYMSPEQARGRTADQRSDVFAFGCVLYEMLTGRQAFHGDEVSDVLASVLKTEPDLARLPARLNPRIRELLQRCLHKNPKFRWHAIADVRIELEAIKDQPEGRVAENAPVVKRPLWRRAIALLVAVVLTAIVAGISAWNLRPSQDKPIVKLPIVLGEGQRFTTLRYGTQIAISRDGTQVVYEANHQLYRRLLSETEGRPIPGTKATQAVLSPAFSPDGQFIAYLDPGLVGTAIKKVPISGGVAATLARIDSNNRVSLTWGDAGILVASSMGVMRVPPNGVNAEIILRANDNDFLSSPQLLPDGQAILLTIWTGGSATGDARVAVQSLKSAEPHILIDNASDARYLPTGHIIYASGTSLFLVPFDARTLKLHGEPMRVLEGVRRSLVSVAQYGFSNNGTLIYIPGPVSTTAELIVPALMDRDGAVEPLRVVARQYRFPRVSPDGKRIAFEIDDGKQPNIWIYEIGGTQAPRQLTVGGANRFPIWSADGARLTFQSDREGDAGIFWQLADGSGTAERLTKAESGEGHIPDSWSTNGDLSFTVTKGSEGAIWTFSLKTRKSSSFVEVKSAMVARSAFSPDGRWLAYQSSEAEAGRSRLWVQPFPATGARYPLVYGSQPFWSPDGTELFYNAGIGGLISKVKITTSPNFAFSDAIPVSQGEFVNSGPNQFPRNADITPDGKLIGLIDAETTKSGSVLAPQIQVVLNWFQELKQLVH
jgi:serine/threonine protein kinase